MGKKAEEERKVKEWITPMLNQTTCKKMVVG